MSEVAGGRPSSSLSPLVSFSAKPGQAGAGWTPQHCGWPVTPVTLTSVTADECFNDRNKREIPVALGLSIAGLLGVLLTACLVARERPGRGYERM